MSLARALATATSSPSKPEAVRGLLLTSSWLTQSGIQEQDELNLGGFYAWYSSIEHQYSYLYSEITGYALTCLLFLDRIIPSPIRQIAVEQAAFWLLDKVWVPDEGGYITKVFPQKNTTQRQIFTFDTGMILNGFLHIYRETDNTFCLAVASRAVDFIMNRMGSPNSMPYPILDLETMQPMQNPSHWSTDIQPYLGKVAIGLLNYADATHSEKVRNYAASMLDWVACQAESHAEGAASRSDIAFHLHPTAYAVEALLVGAVVLDKQRLLNAALKTWRFIADHQLPNGGFPMLVGEGDNFERSDVCAQFIRAGYILEKLGMLPETYVTSIDRALNRLTQLLCDRPDIHSFGSMLHSGPERPERSDPNSWCTMFAIQAFACAAGIPDICTLLTTEMMLV